MKSHKWLQMAISEATTMTQFDLQLVQSNRYLSNKTHADPAICKGW